MTVLNFPASPTLNDTYTENNVIYTWNGTFWAANNAQDLDARFVNVAGDTMTGDLNLPNLVATGDIQCTSINGSPFPGPAFRAYADTQNTITSAVAKKITLGVEDFDTGSCFASSRFTPTVAGYYFVSAGALTNAPATSFTTGVFKNGGPHSWGTQTNSNERSTATALVHLNGSTDYVEFFVYQNSGSDRSTLAGKDSTFLSAFLARPA